MLNNYVTAAWVTGIIVLAIGLVSVLFTQETFGKELDFIEE
jgi:putative MFS transporter